MPRARQGQDRWHRPEWGAPSMPPPRRRRHLPLFLIFLGCVAVWIWQHPEQIPDSLQGLWSEWVTESGMSGKVGDRRVYRWTDAQGVVQFTDRPPAEGVPYERVDLDPNTNVLPPATAPWTDR